MPKQRLDWIRSLSQKFMAEHFNRKCNHSCFNPIKIPCFNPIEIPLKSHCPTVKNPMKSIEIHDIRLDSITSRMLTICASAHWVMTRGTKHSPTCRRRTGWWLGHPSEKYESIGMMTFPIYWKIKNIPNHQSENVMKNPGFRRKSSEKIPLLLKIYASNMKIL